jgi:hypothetical protein
MCTEAREIMPRPGELSLAGTHEVRVECVSQENADAEKDKKH